MDIGSLFGLFIFYFLYFFNIFFLVKFYFVAISDMEFGTQWEYLIGSISLSCRNA